MRSLDFRERGRLPKPPCPPPGTFESFFEDEKDRLLRVLSVITGSRAEAEDIAQEAFTRVFERSESVGAMENPSAICTGRR